jgi:hypothetical protein
MPSQAQLERAAIEQLRIIGGAQTKEDAIVYEGVQWKLPAKYKGDPEGAARELIAFVQNQLEEIRVVRRYDYLPYDGANAVYQCLRAMFGMAMTIKNGRELPQQITIDIGYENGKLQQITVPWGTFAFPGLEKAIMVTDTARNDAGRAIFALTTKCRRCDEDAINGFYDEVGRYLEEHSIYRGKAMTGDMKFIDVDSIDPSKFVYTEQADWEIQVGLLSPLRDFELIRSTGMKTRRATLLEGEYGTGKSGLLEIAMKVGVANDVTCFACRPGQDSPFEVLEVAKMYAGTKYRALVVIEDIDVYTTENDPLFISRFLDAFDSARGKGMDLYLVMTTNHKEEIHKGMLRSGRLDTLIHIGAMDRPGVEMLTRQIIGEHLEADIDFDQVYAATEGYMPAFVREGVERALRAPIALTRAIGLVTTNDLVKSLTSLRPQFELHQAANDRRQKLPPLDQQFRNMVAEVANIDADAVQEAVDNAIYNRMDDIQERMQDAVENKLSGAAILNQDGDRRFEIETN